MNPPRTLLLACSAALALYACDSVADPDQVDPNEPSSQIVDGRSNESGVYLLPPIGQSYDVSSFDTRTPTRLEICTLTEGPEDLGSYTTADWEALESAESSRIHVFIATSPIHRKFKLQLTQEEVLRRAVQGVEMARDFCGNVEFSAEDAARTEPEYLAEVLSAVIAAGATTINVPDTVGYAVPGEFADLIRYLREHVLGIEKAIISVHCHDDLGMAVANSIAAVEAGARQVECTVNGIGERAGNCSLEEIVMAARTRADRLRVDTGVNTTRLYPTSRLVAAVTGVHVPRNKAVVGDNAFAHEAGIHQHGMLRHESTYEIMRPQDVGMECSRLVLGKHSGRHAFRDRVTELGLELDEVELDRAFIAFKQLADRKKEVFDADIEALVLRSDADQSGPWRLAAMNIRSGKGSVPSAEIELVHADGESRRETAEGDGPVAAAFRAIELATGDAGLLQCGIHQRQ